MWSRRMKNLQFEWPFLENLGIRKGWTSKIYTEHIYKYSDFLFDDNWKHLIFRKYFWTVLSPERKPVEWRVDRNELIEDIRHF